MVATHTPVGSRVDVDRFYVVFFLDMDFLQ